MIVWGWVGWAVVDGQQRKQIQVYRSIVRRCNVTAYNTPQQCCNTPKLVTQQRVTLGDAGTSGAGIFLSSVTRHHTAADTCYNLPNSRDNAHCSEEIFIPQLMYWRYLWSNRQHFKLNICIVKLREREGQRVDPGRSLKGHLQIVDGGWWISCP